MLFKELFLVAAKELADTLQEPLANIGVLFDDIMSTGTLGRTKFSASSLFRSSAPTSSSHIGNVEQSFAPVTPVTFGRGQILFAVRQVAKSDSMRLQASGFRFASVTNIIDLLARSMEVTKEELDVRVTRMWHYVGIERILEPGVHLGCFALRPLINRGFDILVHKNAKNMLPAAPLQLPKLEQWQLDFLKQMDSWSVAMCCQHLQGRAQPMNPKEQSFAQQLRDSLSALLAQINAPFFEDARLVARPFEAPCRPNGLETGQATLIAFRILTSAHERTSVSYGYEFASLRFFLCQQHTYKDSTDNQIFARKLRLEFAGVIERRLTEDIKSATLRHSFYKTHRSHKLRASPPQVKKWPARVRSMYSMGTGTTLDDSASDVGDHNSDHKKLVPGPSSQPFGGIQVSSDIDIDVRDMRDHRDKSDDIEMKNLGYYSEIGLDEEEKSFADKLVNLTIEERRRGG